jgi:hypothetical protein
MAEGSEKQVVQYTSNQPRARAAWQQDGTNV